MAPLVATLDSGSLKLAVDQVNAENKDTPLTVFLPGGQEVGSPAPRSAGVRLASPGTQLHRRPRRPGSRSWSRSRACPRAPR